MKITIALKLIFLTGLLLWAGVPFAIVGAAQEKGSLQVSSEQWPVAVERGGYESRLIETGEVLWKVDWTTTITEQNGRKQIQIEEQGKGQPVEYDAPITWKKQMDFELNEKLEFRGLKSTRWAEDGKVYNRQRVEVDPKTSLVTTQFSEATGKDKIKRHKYKPGEIPKEFLFHWTRTLNFENYQKKDDDEEVGECLLIVSPTQRVRMQAEVEGVEWVETPAGSFECYELELEPVIGFISMDLFAPEMTLWCTVEKPHHWIKYEGPAAGPGSPRIEIRLTHFTQEEGVS